MSREIQPAGINKSCSQRQMEDGGVECSGKACQSCTARVMADCVAVCCCPCAVINFFTLTFLKLPWMMGRKCLRHLGSKRKKKKLLKNEGKDVISRKEQGENGNSGKVNTIEEDETGSRKYSARFEAERVWLELYKVDNLGFGRVSFNGIQSLEAASATTATTGGGDSARGGNDCGCGVEIEVRFYQQLRASPYIHCFEACSVACYLGLTPTSTPNCLAIYPAAKRDPKY
ncbi:hypothetical protein L1987_24683 [Smallanthus sonchifolius]|uniref:Uncharacterized protein n=1 Tax=Smallanthus sonchifolius TaxID=185202 RepID=A0ACB9IL29_9ASTR|nr:hypothetical protein L1987_24683 [Smallanthus sonchifolius]